MSWKFSALPSARPPEITLAADCRSGRSLLAALNATKRVCVGTATSRLTVSTGAEPPPAAASNEAVRMVATTLASAASSTVTMALPA